MYHSILDPKSINYSKSSKSKQASVCQTTVNADNQSDVYVQ